MRGTFFLRLAGVALGLYGLLGMLLSIGLLLVSYQAFSRLQALTADLNSERAALSQSVRTVGASLSDTSGATAGFGQSIDAARASADTASQLAFNTSGTFRSLAQDFQLQVFGVQPLVSLVPQVTVGADQLEQTAVSLGTVRDSLGQSSSQVQQVGLDLTQMNQELTSFSQTLDNATIFDDFGTGLVPLEMIVYGLGLLVFLQALFSFIGGIALLRLQFFTTAENPPGRTRTTFVVRRSVSAVERHREDDL